MGLINEWALGSTGIQAAVKIRMLSQLSGTPTRKLWEAGGDNSLQTARSWCLKLQAAVDVDDCGD
jgi:hypothetical protein